MRYITIPGTSEHLSVIALGGHEFLPNGSSRGFNEDFARAVTPGEIFDGFGGPRRQAVLAAAIDAGINFFDVTIDSEKEALGRNLQDLRPTSEIYIQSRPEGMCWGYDPGNRKMTDLNLLRTEVQRICKLLRRPRLDILNLGFTNQAIAQYPGFLERLGDNIRSLKSDGLIRLASADTFSGEAVYLQAIQSGHFDALFLNFSLIDAAGLSRVIPAAHARGMLTNTRELFGKGALFSIGQQAHLADRSRLAQLSIRWNLAQAGVSCAVIGAHDTGQLNASLAALDAPPRGTTTDDDLAILAQLQATDLYASESARRAQAFAAAI